MGKKSKTATLQETTCLPPKSEIFLCRNWKYFYLIANHHVFSFWLKITNARHNVSSTICSVLFLFHLFWFFLLLAVMIRNK